MACRCFILLYYLFALQDYPKLQNGKKQLIPQMLKAFIYSDKNEHPTIAIFY